MIFNWSYLDYICIRGKLFFLTEKDTFKFPVMLKQKYINSQYYFESLTFFMDMDQSRKY